MIALMEQRCAHASIAIDEIDTCRLLAKRSWHVVGMAMAVLPQAALQSPPLLTKQIVKDYPFPRVDPWEESPFET